jgi:hypothetical protein
MAQNCIIQVKNLLGSFDKTGAVVGLTGKAIMKWAKLGRLPRTEATGETQYAELLAEEVWGKHPGIDKRKLKKKLLSTVYRNGRQ